IIAIGIVEDITGRLRALGQGIGAIAIAIPIGIRVPNGIWVQCIIGIVAIVRSVTSEFTQQESVGWSLACHYRGSSVAIAVGINVPGPSWVFIVIGIV